MLFFIWENSDNLKILWNTEFENELGFGKYAGCKFSNLILSGDTLGNVHYYIYVGF